MRKVLSVLSMLVVAVLEIGCGSNGNPNAPSLPLPSSNPTPPPALTFVDGVTGQRVAATVNELGGGRLQVTASGYATRITKFRGSTQLSLWPNQDDTFVREIAFSLDRTNGRIIRAVSGVYLVLSPELYNDGAALAAHQEAAAKITAATGGAIPFVVVNSAPAGGVVFQVTVDPTLPSGYGAGTNQNVQGNVITGGKIGYLLLNYARVQSLVLHELGRALGLNSITTGGIMNVSSYFRFSDFTPDEKIAIRMLVQRPPLTSFRDDDSAVN